MALTYNLPPEAGSGSVLFSESVLTLDGRPMPGVFVRVCTAPSASAALATNTTDAAGKVRFMLDPGTYWLLCSKPGYKFSPYRIEVK